MVEEGKGAEGQSMELGQPTGRASPPPKDPGFKTPIYISPKRPHAYSGKAVRTYVRLARRETKHQRNCPRYPADRKHVHIYTSTSAIQADDG